MALTNLKPPFSMSGFSWQKLQSEQLIVRKAVILDLDTKQPRFVICHHFYFSFLEFPDTDLFEIVCGKLF